MAEKEYIEREAIINKIVNTPTVPSRQCYEGNFVYADGVSGRQNEIINYINEQPTADVVEVVRCKDCKWYKESKLLEPNKFCFRLKDRNGDPIGYNFSSNDFCSYGERKELDNGTKNL